MGREPQVIKKTFNKGKKNEITMKVELFPWEKLDLVDAFKKAFALGNTAKKAAPASPKKAAEAPKAKVAAKPAAKTTAKPVAKVAEKPAAKKSASAKKATAKA
jgi:hypothetical protein